MSQKEDKIWELLGQYKVKAPKQDYISRFWTQIGHQESFPQKISRLFIPKPWALASLTLSVVFIVGIVSVQQQTSHMTASDTEIADNLELAKHWQGIEHVDVLADLDVIEQSDFKVDSTI